MILWNEEYFIREATMIGTCVVSTFNEASADSNSAQEVMSRGKVSALEEAQRMLSGENFRMLSGNHPWRNDNAFGSISGSSLSHEAGGMGSIPGRYLAKL
jgi:hypothetical protein